MMVPTLIVSAVAILMVTAGLLMAYQSWQQRKRGEAVTLASCCLVIIYFLAVTLAGGW